MTSRTLYSCTMSLDGFMAGPGGDMQWLNRHLGPNPVADALVPQIGSLLVGRRTHDGDDPNRGTDAEGAFGGQCRVRRSCSRTRRPTTTSSGRRS